MKKNDITRHLDEIRRAKDSAEEREHAFSKLDEQVKALSKELDHSRQLARELKSQQNHDLLTNQDIIGALKSDLMTQTSVAKRVENRNDELKRLIATL